MNNYDILCCGFLLFFYMFSGVFAQSFIISSDFFHYVFLKIIFILRDIQVLK
jgi:hypothetical protein